MGIDRIKLLKKLKAAGTDKGKIRKALNAECWIDLLGFNATETGLASLVKSLIDEEVSISHIVHTSASDAKQAIKKESRALILTRAFLRESKGQKRASILKPLESKVRKLLGE